MSTLYEELKATGVPMDHHESDLYVPVTEATSAILSRYKWRQNVTTFVSNLDGKRWYDVPFAYEPFWEGQR